MKMKKWKWIFVGLFLGGIVSVTCVILVERSNAKLFEQENTAFQNLQRNYDIDLAFYGEAKPPKYCDFEYRMIDKITEEALTEGFDEGVYHIVNMGCSDEEQKERAKAALTSVGLDETYYEMSPFELSGGEKRRAAIAGVLAMEPEALILDEPSAGLDPRGRDEILGLIRKLWQERGLTVVLVSHSMDEAAKYAQRVIVMHEGVKTFDGPTREVFTHAKELSEIGLGVPSTVRIFSMLRERGIAFPADIDELSIDGAAQALLKRVRDKDAFDDRERIAL